MNNYKSYKQSIFKTLVLTSTLLLVSCTLFAADKNTAPTTQDVIKKLWVNFEPPVDNKFDWIQLKSNEWLKGEIITLYNFELEFDSDELGILKLDWGDVRQVRGAKYNSLQIEHLDTSQKPYIDTGKLVINGNQAYLTKNGKLTTYQRRRIISIAEAGYNEYELWTGDISAGVNFKDGNSELIDSNINLSAIRRSADSSLSLKYTGNFSRVGDIETSNNQRLASDFDLYQNANLFWRVYSAEFYRDTFKNIDKQISLATSFGYKLIRSSETKWEVTGGIGDLYTRYVSVEAGGSIEDTSPFIEMGTVLDTKLTSTMDFLLNYSFQIVDEDFGDYTHYFISTVSTSITGDLELDISFVWERVKNPRPDELGIIPENDDYQLIFGISYEF